MKKIVAVSAVIISLLFSVCGFAYESSIFDDADLFSDYEESEIASSAESFMTEKEYSIAIVTTDYTSGISSEEYAYDYYNNLIDTHGWQENGLLMLIDMDNRNVWISTFGDCILAYSDAEIDSIIDGGYNSLVNGEYADCILEMIEEARVSNTVVDDNDFYIIEDEDLFGDYSFAGNIVEFNGEMFQVAEDGEWISLSDDVYYENITANNKSSLTVSDALIYIVIGLVIAAIVVFVVKSKYKNMGKGDEFSSDDVILNITSSNDKIISRNVVTTRIHRNNNGGSRGGFSGGSTVHRSGGGRSHGGGGRSF